MSFLLLASHWVIVPNVPFILNYLMQCKGVPPILALSHVAAVLAVGISLVS